MGATQAAARTACQLAPRTYLPTHRPPNGNGSAGQAGRYARSKDSPRTAHRPGTPVRGRPGARSDDLPPGVPPSGKGQQVHCLENINGDGAARSKATVNANERQTTRKSALDGSRCRVRHAGGTRHASKAEVTCCDVKRREVTQRTVASCSVVSCYVMQCHVIQCRATRRRGPPLARGGCCRVAFPSVFFLLVSQPAQSYSSGRGQGSQQRRRAKVQPKMQPVGACSSKNCYSWLPLILLSLILL